MGVLVGAAAMPYDAAGAYTAPTPNAHGARMRSQTIPPWSTLLLTTTLLMAGCASVERDKKTIALQAAANGYQSAVRWGYYQTAFGYLHPDLRRGKPLPEGLKDLRVTSYDVVQLPHIQDDGTATQVVNIEYVYEDRQVVKQIADRQVWKWDEGLESWWLKSGLPDFQ
jgi:uncharacterized protein YceK